VIRYFFHSINFVLFLQLIFSFFILFFFLFFFIQVSFCFNIFLNTDKHSLRKADIRNPQQKSLPTTKIHAILFLTCFSYNSTPFCKGDFYDN